MLVDEPVEVDDETLERRRGRERKGRPIGRYLMVVHSQPAATQIAVLEGRALIEHYVSRKADDATQIDGNIYLGRVQNVLPGMEAAFIDIGTPKNAVLYRGDVRYDKDDLEAPPGGGVGAARPGADWAGAARTARIEQLLKTGQTIVCQVTKNPIGTKGARLTQEVSLPGRFVVLIPGSDTYGISKRLPDEERKRLRRILDEVRPAGHGLIVRTAAEGATADELRRDVARLSQQWERIDAMAKIARTPALLYREPDMAVRVIREEFNRNYRGVVIDDRDLYEEVRDYVASISPELADRVEWAGDSDDPLPVFERYHVHEQIHKALDRKVWLAVGRFADHRAHRGPDRHRREHRQERRHLEPGGDRLPQQPRGGGGDRPPAAAARHRRDHRDRLHRHGDRRQPRRGDQDLPGRAGPRQDPDPGVRHLRARSGRDDSQADLRGTGRVVFGDLPHLRGPGDRLRPITAALAPWCPGRAGAHPSAGDGPVDPPPGRWRGSDSFS